MKAFVDPSLCTGCGLCVDLCPEVFQLGDDGLAVAVDQTIRSADEQDAHQAADECPVAAIRVET